jgi:hypothetical protein
MTMSSATEEKVDRNDALEMWADSVIEQRRFSCLEDRALSRYESDTPSLMPSSDELSDIGFDLVGLAMALEAGLDAELFGKAYRFVVIPEFNIALVALGAGLDVALYNEGMDQLVERMDDRA